MATVIHLPCNILMWIWHSPHQEMGFMFCSLECEQACDDERHDPIWLTRSYKTLQLLPGSLGTHFSTQPSCKKEAQEGYRKEPGLWVQSQSWAPRQKPHQLAPYESSAKGLLQSSVEPSLCVPQTWAIPTGSCPICRFMSREMNAFWSQYVLVVFHG